MIEQIQAFFRWLKQPAHLLALLFSLIPIYFVFAYMAAYTRNVPVADQWHYSSDVAVAAQEGDLSLALLTEKYNDHRVLFTNIVTAINASLTDWNLRAEAFLNLAVALGYFVLLLAVFYRQNARAFALALVPLAAIVFSLNQQPNWLAGHHSGWHFVLLFYFAALYVVTRAAVGWRPLIWAAVLCVAANFSIGSGALAWFLMPFVLWMLGYRHPAYFIFWTAAAAISLGVYIGWGNAPSTADTQTFGPDSIRLDDPLSMVLYVVTMLGNAVSFFELSSARVIGVLGLVVFALNVFYLRDWRRVAVWLGIAGYGVGATVAITLGRFHPDTPELAMTNRFVGATLPFWMALVAVMVIVSRELWGLSSPTQRQRGLLIVNILFAALLGTFYLRASVFTLQIAAEPTRYNHRLGLQPDVPFEEACLRNYPRQRDFECFEQVDGWLDGAHIPQQVYRLAAYRLAAFADDNPVSVLPPSYQQGSPVIVDSPSRWLNVYMRDWMLDGVSAEAIFHITSESEPLFNETVEARLGEHVTTEFDADSLADFVTDHEQVWVLLAEEVAAHESDIAATLGEAGFLPTVAPITQPDFADAAFTLIRFQRQPEEFSELFRFGEDISLQAWSLASLCEPLIFESWWLADEVPALNYSSTLVLEDANGEVIARHDAGIANIPMQLWEPGQYYFDARTLDIPCDIPQGEYILKFGVYDVESLASLPLTDADGESGGELAEITILDID